MPTGPDHTGDTGLEHGRQSTATEPDEERSLWVFQCYDEALGQAYTHTFVVRATKSAVEQLEADLRGRGHVSWCVQADVTVPDQIRAKHGWWDTPDDTMSLRVAARESR